MKTSRSAEDLISVYPSQLQSLVNDARKFLLNSLKGSTEEVDTTAAVLSYGYGPNYRDMVCTLILSKTGVKLGFVNGAQLDDPQHLLEGSGKLHKYVQLKSASDLDRAGLKELIDVAQLAWRKRTGNLENNRRPTK